MEILLNQPPNLLFHHERDWVAGLPMDAPGVDGILLYIRQLPGFDEIAFQDAFSRVGPARIPLLRRAPMVNALLNPTGDDAEDRSVFTLDFDLGFRLASSGEHIAWSTTLYSALAHFGVLPSGNKGSEFRIGPVQLGALQVNEIAASSGIYRSDIPLSWWETRIVLLQDGWRSNEHQLNAYFRRMLGDPEKVESWDYLGETTKWKRGGISLTVSYRKSTLRYPENGFCDFLVHNDRSYPELLTDDYCRSVQPADVKAKLFSVPKIKLSGWYSLSPYIRATPPGLLGLFSSSVNFLVWIDRDGTHVGFADRSFAAIYPHAAIARLSFQNRIPDRGGLRSSSLTVELIGQEGRDIVHERCRSAGEGDYGAFDSILDEIATLTGLTVQKLDDFDER